MHKWTKEEVELLRTYYPTLGSAIPVLRERFSQSVIVSKAKSLGLSTSVRKLGTVVWDGKIYPTLTSACNAAGLNTPSVLTMRYHSGDSVQEAFDKALARKDKKKPGGRATLDYEGKVWSYKSLAEHTGADASRLYYYISKKGMAIGDAIERAKSTPCRPGGPRNVNKTREKIDPITVFDVVCYSKSDVAKQLGVSLEVMLRAQRGEHLSFNAVVERFLSEKWRIAKAINSRESRDIRVISYDVGDVFTCTCTECGRTILLSHGELAHFEHSEEFCSSHEWEEI